MVGTSKDRILFTFYLSGKKIDLEYAPMFKMLLKLRKYAFFSKIANFKKLQKNFTKFFMEKFGLVLRMPKPTEIPHNFCNPLVFVLIPNVQGLSLVFLRKDQFFHNNLTQVLRLEVCLQNMEI